MKKEGKLTGIINLFAIVTITIITIINVATSCTNTTYQYKNLVANSNQIHHDGLVLKWVMQGLSKIGL